MLEPPDRTRESNTSHLPTISAMRIARSSRFFLSIFTLCAFSACGSGGSSEFAPGAGSPFILNLVSIVEGDRVKLNQSIDFTFNAPVDLATVNLNTISIQDQSGVSAQGQFYQPTDSTGVLLTSVLRFKPMCPRLDDYSDAGLSIGGTYTLIVKDASASAGGNTILSTAGSVLQTGVSMRFFTPSTTDPIALFQDSVAGPPKIRIRGVDGVSATASNATYLEVGGDLNQREYFDAQGLSAFEVPLNKYSDSQSTVAAVVFFNEDISAHSQNIHANRIAFEYLDEVSGSWQAVGTRVSLDLHCTEVFSSLKLEPLGLLPQGSDLRIILRQGFSDIVGTTTTQDETDFALMHTRTVLDAQGQATEDADEFFVDFILGGESEGSFEDVDADVGFPKASWGIDGKLKPAAFSGTGGTNGEFDYHVPSGQTIIIDTTMATITGGPSGAPTSSQTIVNGVIDVRDFLVPADSRVIFMGPNPATILASGTVTIAGELSCNGSNHSAVPSIDTTFIPTPGAPGQAGGGDGGGASQEISISTAQGETGQGAFGAINQGGQGGETGYSNNGNRDFRRGAGGGGGTLGSNQLYDHVPSDLTDTLRECQTLIGMDSESGFGGGLGLGAVSQTERAMGGMVGLSPFAGSSDDNFYGGKFSATGGIITGELSKVWAGAGGGGGGDASRTRYVPTSPVPPIW